MSSEVDWNCRCHRYADGHRGVVGLGLGYGLGGDEQRSRPGPWAVTKDGTDFSGRIVLRISGTVDFEGLRPV